MQVVLGALLALHVRGLAGEEVLDEVRSGNRERLRAELLDIAGAALKAVRQIDRGAL
jgi:hypothetical protein